MAQKRLCLSFLLTLQERQKFDILGAVADCHAIQIFRIATKRKQSQVHHESYSDWPTGRRSLETLKETEV